jgi:hypothetical protein
MAHRAVAHHAVVHAAHHVTHGEPLRLVERRYRRLQPSRTASVPRAKPVRSIDWAKIV